MRKNILGLSIILVTVILATISTTLSIDTSKDKANFNILLKNAEAIASSSEGGGGLTIFRVCSKKDGSVFCSNRRGNRKWAINVNINFGVAGGIVCPECPDQDFDYTD